MQFIMNTRRKQRGFEVQDVDVQVKTSEKLVTCQKAGASYGKMCFSHDSRYLFCCYGSDIRVVSNTSGECLHDLKHHTKTVTGILVNPGNVLQLYSCGKDKLLIVWDYLDGAKLKEYNLHSPLYGIVSADENSIIMIAEGIAKENQLQGLPSVQPKDKRDALKLWTQLHSAALGHAKYRILQWKKTNDTKSQFENPKRLIEDCSANSGLVSFGCSKKIVASAMSTELTIYFMKSDEQIVLKDDNKFTKAYTCVACHPNEEVVAAGLNNGMIYLWHIKGRNGVKSCIHWHSLPLLCLAYTPDGSHLLSGGHECVLVKWPTHRLQEKTFKPRMGAPLTQLLVAPDGLHTASQHLDNAIQLLDNNLKVLQVYQGMTRSWLTGNPVSCGLTFDPDSQSLVTNGMPGHLQFFSPALNKQLFNLDIVGENYISPENLQDGPTVTKIHCMALSASGRWLATYQSWDDGKFTPELKLKFWQWKSEAETYVLNTTVESPHDDHVTFMMFRPLTTNQSQDNLELLTLGADACFKCWGLMDDTDIYRSNQRWDCDYVGQHRGLRVVAADFSPDGTALAVGFEHLVTLWNPDLYKVQATLAQATEGRPAVSHVLFGSKDCSHNLVVATNMTLVIWDLRTLTIQWQLDHNITHLLRDPATNLMAYIIDEQSLCVFSPASPTPVYQHGALACSVLSAVFIPGGRGGQLAGAGWPGDSQLCLLTRDEELLTLELPGGSAPGGQVKIAENLPSSAMQAFMAEKQTRQLGQDGATRGGGGGGTRPATARTRRDQEFINAMLHSNEPVSSLCGQFLNYLLVKKSSKQNPSKSKRDKDNDSDDDSSSDMEIETEEKAIEPDVNDETKDKSEDDNLDDLVSGSLDWIKWAADVKIQ